MIDKDEVFNNLVQLDRERKHIISIFYAFMTSYSFIVLYILVMIVIIVIVVVVVCIILAPATPISCPCGDNPFTECIQKRVSGCSYECRCKNGYTSSSGNVSSVVNCTGI